MSFVGSYLWSVRQAVGHRLLLVPGAQVLVLDTQDRVLLQQNTDYGQWGLPAGACEEGQSFTDAAVSELYEETGLKVNESDLTAFACLSDPSVHTLRYPNGDITHCFALCFETRTFSGKLTPGEGEVASVDFFPLDALPDDLHPPTVVVLDLHAEYRRTGRFQAR